MEFFSTTPKTNVAYNKKVMFNAGVEASIDYHNGVNTFSPQIKFLFSPYGLPFIPIEILGTNVNKIISNLSWTKDRNNPGGLLNFTVVPDSQIIDDIVKILNQVSGNLYSKIWGELGVDLEDLFKPMTLCQLWIDDYHIMTGNVRSCIRSSSALKDGRTVSYNITVDELGNLYNMNTMSLNLQINDNMLTCIADNFSLPYDLISNLKATTLDNVILALTQAFNLTSLQNNFSASDGIPLFIRMLALPNPLGAISRSSYANNLTVDSNIFRLSSSDGGQSSLWDFLKSFIPSPWMEFYCESGGRTIVTDPFLPPALMFPGFNYVVARSVPYSNPMLGTVNPAFLAQSLTFDLNVIQMLAGGDFIIITDDIIEDKNLGFDCINQHTVFHTQYASRGVSGGSMDINDVSIKTTGPLNPFASGGMKTFGIREMFTSIDCTNFIELGTAKQQAQRIGVNTFGIPGEIVSKPLLSNLLATWFRNQSRFREGDVTCRYIPYARAGMYCLYLPSLSGKKVENLRDIGLYYIDSLNHNYNLEDDNLSFTTTLNLIRGVPLPLSVAQTALLLFDFEILPPMVGIGDGGLAAGLAVTGVTGV